ALFRASGADHGQRPGGRGSGAAGFDRLAGGAERWRLRLAAVPRSAAADRQGGGGTVRNAAAPRAPRPDPADQRVGRGRRGQGLTHLGQERLDTIDARKTTDLYREPLCYLGFLFTRA